MRIAITGLGPSHDKVPYDTWETWGLPWDAWSPRYSRLFEMHDRELFERRGDDYLTRLREADVPIHMQQVHEDIPMSVGYPLKEVSELVGDYYASSLSYMLGLAMLSGASEIGLWGFDLTNDYDHQRPNVEYMIGYARGKGINVSVYPGLLLSREVNDMFLDEKVVYPHRYGAR